MKCGFLSKKFHSPSAGTSENYSGFLFSKKSFLRRDSNIFKVSNKNCNSKIKKCADGTRVYFHTVKEIKRTLKTALTQNLHIKSSKYFQ